MVQAPARARVQDLASLKSPHSNKTVLRLPRYIHTLITEYHPKTKIYFSRVAAPRRKSTQHILGWWPSCVREVTRGRKSAIKLAQDSGKASNAKSSASLLFAP